MGHIGRLKAEYRELAGRLQRGPVAFAEPTDEHAWEGWRDILEILYTPEEAALATKMPVRPTSLGKLAARTGEAAETLRPRLETMADKGLVLDLVDPKSGETSWMLSPPVVGFFEFSLMRAKDTIPKKRMAEALHAYTHGDDAFHREVFGGDTTVGRALVHEPAVADDLLPDVLDWQRASEVVGAAQSWAVSLCFCRHKAEHLGQACGAPMEICLSLNAGAEFVIRRKFGRPIERAEALEILARSREQGLVQIADNVRSRPTFVCNCCGCCCEQLQGANRWGIAAVNPSGFAPRRDASSCSGCSRCARACPVAAIEMKPERRNGQQKNGLAPTIDDERCIGCGVCATACHKGALQMAPGGSPRPVPQHGIERMVRMAIERGRLADLLFDQGAGLGSRFLHGALAALTALPPASRLLAAEQVKSRFVRAILSAPRS